MKVVIKGNPKEIAALVLVLQERREFQSIDLEVGSQSNQGNELNFIPVGDINN